MFCFYVFISYVLPVFLSKSVHLSNYDRYGVFFQNYRYFFKTREHKFDRVVESLFSKFQVLFRIMQKTGLGGV